MSTGEIFNTDEPEPWESAEDDEDFHPQCTRCGGTGISIEGLDCEYCDGYGYCEI